MRLIKMIRHDIQFQWRHRFYFAYMVVCSVYLLLLHGIPSGYKEKTAMLLTFSDPSALGLIFAGGILLLEKDQGIHDCLFVTPLRLTEYLVAKACSLSLLSLIAAWVIHGFSLGMPSSPFLFSLGVLLSSSFFTLLSIGVVVRTQSINGFILLIQLYALPFTIPLLSLLDWGPRMLYSLFPTYGSLLLLSSIYRPIALHEIIYAIGILIVGNIAIFIWARHSFQQRILLG
ncbi:fluoroquinolone transport system permease protein [Paenibacillus castaneae]|uniref:fluoroquinolone export ABC transporter permease subunit n=1 Tax=Paenibacillus castaneae TaxID=474957 RepID=UPI000C9C93FA|nr:ABC transporter permease [Paenibacillus castaneae]NIK79277.1 fluoroquinolone transport system permease protein [Paenibacillus castaneae]